MILLVSFRNLSCLIQRFYKLVISNRELMTSYCYFQVQQMSQQIVDAYNEIQIKSDKPLFISIAEKWSDLHPLLVQYLFSDFHFWFWIKLQVFGIQGLTGENTSCCFSKSLRFFHRNISVSFKRKYLKQLFIINKINDLILYWNNFTLK